MSEVKHALPVGHASICRYEGFIVAQRFYSNYEIIYMKCVCCVSDGSIRFILEIEALLLNIYLGVDSVPKKHPRTHSPYSTDRVEKFGKTPSPYMPPTFNAAIRKLFHLFCMT